MDERVQWHQELTYRTGVNDTFTVADSDIVTRLRNHVRGDYEKTAEFMLSEAADEIERLRNGIEKYVTTVSDSYCTNAMERDALELLKEIWRG